MEGKGSRSVAQVGERGGSEDTEGEEGELVARRGRSRAEPVASTVGWRVRHRVRRGEEGGGQGRVGNYRGPERRGL